MNKDLNNSYTFLNILPHNNTSNYWEGTVLRKKMHILWWAGLSAEMQTVQISRGVLGRSLHADEAFAPPVKRPTERIPCVLVVAKCGVVAVVGVIVGLGEGKTCLHRWVSVFWVRPVDAGVCLFGCWGRAPMMSIKYILSVLLKYVLPVCDYAAALTLQAYWHFRNELFNYLCVWATVLSAFDNGKS